MMCMVVVLMGVNKVRSGIILWVGVFNALLVIYSGGYTSNCWNVNDLFQLNFQFYFVCEYGICFILKTFLCYHVNFICLNLYSLFFPGWNSKPLAAMTISFLAITVVLLSTPLPTTLFNISNAFFNAPLLGCEIYQLVSWGHKYRKTRSSHLTTWAVLMIVKVVQVI